MTAVTKKWLSKLTTIDLKYLANVESQIIGEIKPEATVFEHLGHDSFLKFITTNESLEDVLEFGFSTSSLEMLGSKVAKEELISFVHQCGSGRSAVSFFF